MPAKVGRKRGRPSGTTGIKWQKTIAKEEARELTRQIITRRLEKLIDAQLENAVGIRHLMMRDPKTGKFERVVSRGDSPELEQAQIDAAIATGNGFWIYTKDPSVQAFTDLMNRALDKPAEQIQLTGESGGPIQVEWLKPDES